MKEWWSCQGYDQTLKTSRRGVLVGAGLAMLSLGLRRSSLAQVAIRTAKQPRTDETLVVIFLRGGADGLNIVVPHAEDDYYRARPALAISRPNDRSTNAEDRCLDLDGFFGFHPAMAPLLTVFKEGKLGLVHAVGSMDGSHSHFEAMNAMERGLAASGSGNPSGWLARHLLSSPASGDSTLRAVSIGETMPDSLRGAPTALALRSLDDFKLQGSGDFRSALEQLYTEPKDAYARAGSQTLKALRTLEEHQRSTKAAYPQTDLGQGLRQVAELIKADVGLEVACLDRGGWDTHVAQGRGTGILANQLSDLASSCAAFAKDLGESMSRVTLVVQTEFGRRVRENDGQGTDHGHGSFMMLMGGGTRPGVHAKWPGLKVDQLSGPGDLQVTTDYRNVLAEVLDRRLGNPRSSEVFPRLQTTYPGITA